MTGVLPLAPFPPLHWWSVASQGAPVDGQEPFVKQTERTRLRLASAQGVTNMPWDVVHGEGIGAMRDVKLSEHTPSRIRWRSLCTNYGAAPFFEHIAPELEDLFMRPPVFLLDLSIQSWEWVAEWTGWEVPKLADGACPWDQKRSDAGQDLRERRTFRGEHWKFDVYPQVFSPERGFIERCSVLDALMHLGPELGGKLHHLAFQQINC